MATATSGSGMSGMLGRVVSDLDGDRVKHGKPLAHGIDDAHDLGNTCLKGRTVTRP